MMAPRTCSTALALLAFTVTIFAGLWVQNPVSVVLSRALTAMVIFAFIGLGMGWAATTVVREQMRSRESTMFGSEESDRHGAIPENDGNSSTRPDAKPMGT